MSNLLKEYVKNILVELSFKSAREVADAIVAAGSAIIGVPTLQVKKASNKEIRIAAAEGSYNFTDDQISGLLKKSGLVIVTKIPKKEPGSRSGTFPTYIVRNDDDDDSKYPVVFSRGKNEGQQFEDAIDKEAEDLQKEPTKPPAPLIASLCKAIGLDVKNIEKSKRTGMLNQSRHLLSDIPNVGSKVADITFELKQKDENSANSSDGKTVYISLKNPRGTTFANMGYASGFVEGEDENGDPIVLSNERLAADHVNADIFLKALGVDKELAAKGFTNVLRGSRSTVVDPLKRFSKKNPPLERDAVGSQDYKTVKTYLASAYGFGYWYVRHMGGDDWYVKKINSSDDARDMVGEIKRIDISYPGVTKQITCNVITTTGRYIIEVRNTQGGIIPKQVNVSVG